MNNLHRELAPISSAAWSGIEDEARRTFTLHVAGRRVADVREPGGVTLAAVATGHLTGAEPPAAGVTAGLRQVQPLAELRVPFTLKRRDIDDAERGARDPDWQPVKDAARTIAGAEDRAILEGYPAAGITGIKPASSHPPLALPDDAGAYPGAVSQALAALRLSGVGGPYALLLSAEAYTALDQESGNGCPVRDHVRGMIDGDIIWAPAIDGGLLLSARGGDYELHLGQDLSIGYLTHDAEHVRLYFTESFTFFVCTAEAAVPLTAAPPIRTETGRADVGS